MKKILLFLSLFTAINSFAIIAGDLDQNVLDGGDRIEVRPGSFGGQTFIVGITGQLLNLDLNIQSVINAGIFSVEIYKGSYNNGTIVATPGILIAQSGLISLDISSYYVNACAGDTMYFKIISLDVGDAFFIAAPDVYPNGNALELNTTNMNKDISFSTYVLTSTNCIPFTNVSSSSCGTIASINDLIYCDAVEGATDYMWNWDDGQSINQSVTRNAAYNDFKPSMIPGIQAGNSYTVTVKAKVDGQWGEFGSSCYMYVAPMPTTYITDGCGTVDDINQSIYCQAVSGAEDYMWSWSDGGSFNKEVDRNATYNDFKPAMVAGLEAGINYSVAVKAKVNGIWGDYGTACNISITPISTPSITSGCGTLTSMDQFIYCTSVSGAQDYLWTWTASGFNVSVSRQAAYNDFKATMVPGIQSGTTYSVSVQVKVNGVWSSAGEPCSITTPSIGTTSIGLKWCNKTLSQLIQTIKCYPVAGAQDYEWQWVNLTTETTFTKRRGNNYNDFSTRWVPGFASCQTWQVSIRAKVGGAWGDFSTVCTISTPNTCRTANNDSSTPSRSLISNEDATMLVYPNPSNGEQINVEIAGIDNETPAIINIYDIYGKHVYREQLNNVYNGQTVTLNNNGELAKGVYLLNIDIKNTRLNEKLIIH